MGIILLRQKTTLALFIILLTVIPFTFAQDDTTPLSLLVKVYPDGSALLTYHVESDPTKVRVDVEIFGESYSNLIIRDEDGLPLGSTVTATGLTIDTIGASELNIVYSTSDLTTKDGPLWNLNITSPISTRIILPQGAAIFDLSEIPTDIGNIDGAQYIELPAGEVYVSFILALPNLDAEAQAAIEEAESYLSAIESQGYILTKARSELTQAEQIYESDQFVEAKNTALHAIVMADEAIEDAQSAATEIALATTVIEQAQDEGKTVGLPQAQNTMASAETYYNQGLYVEAKTAAKQASQLALTTEKPSGGNTMIYAGFLVLVVAAAGGYYYMQNMRKEEPQTASYPPETEVKTVLLEKILQKHSDLRLEDREVIKFLAETNGEAFATEIRDRFDMPRSSAWRLIRRLVSLGIVEEVKIGNQSLVRVHERYLQ
jgi:uncharacterized membrane protein